MKRVGAALMTAAALFGGSLALAAGAPDVGAPPAFAQPAASTSTTTAGAPAPAPAAPTATTSPTRLTGLPPRAVGDGAAPLRIVLSGPVSPTSPEPTLVPAVSGRWSVTGDMETFTPAASLSPCSSYELVIWARTEATGHAQLGHRRTLTLHVACPPLTGLQLALSRLGYLGASFRPRHPLHVPSGRLSAREAASLVYAPPAGTLVADPASAPPLAPGRLDATTRGALEVFQEDNGLPVSGEATRATWLSMLADLRSDHRDPRPYTWVTVSEGSPETLYLHRGQRLLLTTLVNTGVAGAETATGIFPIYARYVSTSMSGEDPDGTKYDVPDVPWVNYFNGGDAVHGYPRAAYGFPQSNGCVELPIEAARWVYGALQIGDIVWVR